MQLVINSFGSSIKRNGEMFQISLKDKKTEISARRIHSVLITTGAHFSTDSIQLAIEHNIDIVLLDKYGTPYGRFWSGRMGSSAAIRRAQFTIAENEQGLNIVKEWLKTKLNNQVLFIKELYHHRKDKKSLFEPAIELINKNQIIIESLKGSVTEQRQKLLGLEGSSASAYWSVLGKLPPAPFQFDKRSQNPATDPVNAMINYAYGVLYSKVERGCIIAGLDPYVGFLHTDRYNKKSLVFDLIEPFRIFADRVVLKLFTGRKCRESMFRKDSSSAIVLEKSAKELLITRLNDYLEESVRYKIKSSKTGKTRQIKRRDTIQAEAHSLANAMIGKNIDDIPKVTEIGELFD